MTIRNLLIMQENEFSGTISMYPSTLQPLCTNWSQIISKYVSQPHILVYMLNISTCRTCPKAELAPVSPTVILFLHVVFFFIIIVTVPEGIVPCNGPLNW